MDGNGFGSLAHCGKATEGAADILWNLPLRGTVAGGLLVCWPVQVACGYLQRRHTHLVHLYSVGLSGFVVGWAWLSTTMLASIDWVVSIVPFKYANRRRYLRIGYG